MKIASLEIELMAGIARLQRDMNSAVGVVDRSMRKIEQQVQRVQRAFGALGLGLGLGVMVRQAQQLSDAWQGMENRLRLVTSSSTQLSRALNDVYVISQRTSSGLDATSQVYQRFAQNAGSLGINMQQVAALTETVSKAVAVSGATAAASDAALMQFGQALASGVLRGEEFNSIIEQTPALMQAIADGMGVPLGAMRGLAQEGKITGDVIVEALTRASGSVDDRFSTRILTIYQAWTNLNNSITRYVGELTQATGASSGIAEMIVKISESIDRARESMGGLNRELDGIRVFADLVVEAWGAVNEFGRTLQEWAGKTEGQFYSLSDAITTSFTSSFLSTAKEVDAIARVIGGHVQGMTEIYRALGHNIVTIFKNAFETVKEQLSMWLHETAQLLNKLPGVDISTSIYVGPGKEELRNLIDAYKEGWQVWEGGLGAYEALAKRVGDKGIWRAATDAMATYGDTVEKTTGSTSSLSTATEKGNKKLTEAQKAAQAFARQREQAIKAQYAAISAIHEEARGIEDQVALYGLSRTAIEDLAIARLEEQAALLSGMAGAEEQLEIFEREIEARKRLRTAIGSLEQKEAERQAWESWARDVEQIFQQVGQSLTDAIFEGGKSARDLVRDLFKTLTLRVLVQPVMGGLQAMLTGVGPAGVATGGSAAGGLMGSPTSLFSMFGGNSMGMGISNALTGLSSSSMLAGTGVGNWMTGVAGNVAGMSNLALGGAGLLGGLGANLIFGGKGHSGIGGGLGSTVGMALGGPIGAVAGTLIGGGLGSLFGDREPTTRREQRTQVEYAGGLFDVTKVDDRAPAGADAAARALAEQAVSTANDIFRQVGVDAAIDSFHAIMASSYAGDRDGVASGGRLRIGDEYRQFGIANEGNPTIQGFGGWSSAETLPRLATDIQLSVLEAFQSVGDQLPSVLSTMLEGIDVRSLGEQEAQALAERFASITQGASQFLAAIETMPFEQLRDLSFDAAAGMVQFAGGIDNLLASQQTYYERFYSDAERHGHAVDQLTQALAGVGVEMPALVGSTDDMLASYRALVESLDLNTEAGQQAYVTLMQAAGAFADVAEFAGQAAEATRAAAQRAAEDQRRAAEQARQQALSDLSTAYNAVVQAGQRDIARLKESFAGTDSAMNAYRSKVQEYINSFNGLFSAIDQGLKALRGTGEAFEAQYRQARAVISTTLVTGQLPQTADLTDALRIAQQGVTGQVYASQAEQEKAYAILANEMEAIKDIAGPELDAAQATLNQLEDQYRLLRGMSRVGEDSLEALEEQLRTAIATEEAARHQISVVEQQLEEVRRQYDALTGIDTSIKDLATAMREFAAAARTVVVGGGGGGGGAGAQLSAAERDARYYAAKLDLMQRTGDTEGGYDWSRATVDDLRKYAEMIGITPEEHYKLHGRYEGLSYDKGTSYVPYDMRANIHKGEIIIDPRSSDILRRYGIGVQGGTDKELISEVRALREQVARLEAPARDTARSTGQLANQFDNVTAGGNAMLIEDAATL